MFNFFRKKDSATEKEPTHCSTEKEKSSGWTLIKNSFRKTKEKIFSQLLSSTKTNKLDSQLLEQIEDALIMADCGFEATQSIIEDIKSLNTQYPEKSVHELLEEIVYQKACSLEKDLRLEHNHKPFVILVCGVNGAGKTTTIGKLTNLFIQQNKTVLLAAGDTFRAAATDQLKTWADRNQVSIVAQEKGEPASVIYDAIQSAIAKNIDIVIADTAGRLSTQSNLMEELKKVNRVAEKALGQQPQEKILVLDGTMGQNILLQIAKFRESMGGLTGLIVTKLDSSAKGGTVLSIAQKDPTPIYFIGSGEKIEDIAPFSAKEYTSALFDGWEELEES